MKRRIEYEPIAIGGKEVLDNIIKDRNPLPNGKYVLCGATKSWSYTAFYNPANGKIEAELVGENESELTQAGMALFEHFEELREVYGKV